MKEWLDNKLLERIKFMWSSRESVYSRLNSARETIIERFRPDKDLDVGSNYDMRLLGHDIYDGTGVSAVHTMAVGFYAHQYSKNVDWIHYKFWLDVLKEVDELDQFCSDLKDHQSSAYQKGNFYNVQLGYAKNAITIGSPCVFIEENVKTSEIIHKPLHYSTFRLFYDIANRTEGVVTKEQWTIKEIYDKFCEGNTREVRLAKAKDIFSNSTMKYIDGGQWSKKITIWRAVFRKRNPVFYSKNFGSQYEWWGCYFEDTPKDKDVPLMTEGYFTKPFAVWDYEKNPDESASRTPAFYSLYDDVTLNNIMLNYITDVQMGARPPMAKLKEDKGEYDLGPGDSVYLDRQHWEYAPKFIERGGKINWEVEQLKMFRENVRMHFHTKLFNILTELALANKQPISATQTLEIQDEKITQISPMIESNDDYLRQVDERTLDIEYRAGRGPFRPDNMMYIADVIGWACRKAGVDFNGELVPEFIGKLRRQQQMEQKLKPLMLGMDVISRARETIDEDLNVAVRGYDVLDDGLSAVDFPMKNLKPKDEYEEDMAQIQEGRAQQLQIENTIEAMKASKGLKPTGQEALPAGTE